MSTKHDNRPKLENPPKDDLAGLRNAVRLAWFAADRGELGEVKLQLEGLIDDLTAPRVRFQWATAAERAEDEAQNRRNIGEYAATLTD